MRGCVIGSNPIVLLEKSPKVLLIAIGVAIAAAVEGIDYVTGPEIAFYVFYLIPVAFFAWYCGIVLGASAAFLCAIAAEATDLATGARYSSFAHLCWSTGVKISVLVIVSLALSKIRKEMTRQREDHRKLLVAYEEIQKLARIKSEFAATVSHELRTPLAAIRESVNLFHDGSLGCLNSDQKKYAGITLRNVDRLNRLINDVLDFSKLESGKSKASSAPGDLNALIEETVRFYEPAASSKGLILRADTDAKIPRFSFDADGIARVLTNAIGNAVKFTESGNITVTSRSAGGGAEVIVRDSGCGMKDEDLPKLFKPFVRIPRDYGKNIEGTGLGLAICKMLIDQHKGRIWLESGLGKGTALHFTLPIN